MRCSACLALMTIVSLSLPLSGGSHSRRADSQDRIVRSILQREASGTITDRAARLREMSHRSRMGDEANWQSGRVRVGSRWTKFDEAEAVFARSRTIAGYRRVRDSAAQTRDGQLAVADWCRRNQLPLREQAHLTAALDLSKEHDEPAIRRRLGFVNVNHEWVHRDELREDQNAKAEERRRIARWQPRIQAWFRQSRTSDRKTREAALRKLRNLNDPSVLPALHAVLATRDVASARLHVDILSRMSTHLAADELARIAVTSKWKSARDAAALQLRARPIEAFAPELLAMLKLPINSRISLTRHRGGLLFVHEASQETQHKRRAIRERRTIRASAGQPRNNPGRRTKALDRLLNPATVVRERATALEQSYAKQNWQIAATNQRVCAVLKEATGLQIPATPQRWWSWWQAYNQMSPGDKDYRALNYYETRLASIPNSARRLLIPSNIPPLPPPKPVSMPKDCLVRGTKIWTDRGLLAIERVRVGDLVPAKHPETGELSYKPVLRTSRRSPEPTVAVMTRGGTIRATGGHQLWISGKGWVRLRDAKPGDRLHGAKGSSEILAIKKVARAETFNLLIADFHTYFVGKEALLSHDMTFAEPTDVLVPGLKPVYRK